MPKVIAERSMTKPAITGFRVRTKERPERIERSTGSCAVTVAGGWADIIAAAPAMPRQLTASTVYGVVRPKAAIRTPPSPGPATWVSW